MLQDPDDVAATIRQYAGVGKLDALTTAAETRPAPVALSVAPNPTAGRATLTVDLPAPGVLNAVDVDVLGRRVRSLADATPLGAGPHHLEADLRALPPGAYVAVVRVGAQTVTHRVTVVR